MRESRGSARARGGHGNALRRRVILLLIPGILCIAIALGGVALVERWESGGGPPARPDTACDPTAQAPEIDLGVRPRGGIGRVDGSRVSYPTLDRAQVRRMVARARGAGAATISTPALWTDLQPRAGAPYDWRLLDIVVDESRAQGLKVRLRTGTMPAFAYGRWSRSVSEGVSERWRPPFTRAELRRWSAFLGALTRHVAGRVDYVEIWNEPNTWRYWPTGPDPAAFARLLAASYRPIKRVEPSITVISGGLEHNDLGFLRAAYDAREALGSGERTLFDQVGVHPYSDDRAPDVASGTTIRRGYYGEIDRTFAGFRALRQVMRHNGDDAVPLYIGEFGYRTSPRGTGNAISDATRARYLRIAFETARCDGVHALSWFALHPGPRARPGWALLDRHGHPTLTYRALRRYAEAAGSPDEVLSGRGG